jgi:hypothetical protein
MDALRLFALLIYTFGAFAYGAMLVMWMRELGRLGWGARTDGGDTSREADAVNGVLLVVSFAWFVCNVAQLLVSLTPQRQVWQLDVAGVLLAFSFPPLIMHVTCAEVVATNAARVSRGWRIALWPAYVLSATLPIWLLAVGFGGDAQLERTAAKTAQIALSAAFVAAAAYSIALVSRADEGGAAHRTARAEKEDRQARWSLVGMFGAMAVLFLLMLWASAMAGFGSRPPVTGGAVLEIAAKSLPLVFVFVSTYFENRFEFFDLFVKRGAAFLIAIGVLTIWSAVTLPLLRPLLDTWAAPWIYAVALIPAVGAIAWLNGRAAATLDRRWIGRRYATVDALTHFVSELRPATSRAQAVERAAQALTEIFGAPAAVRLDGDAASAGFDVEHERAIDGPQGERGRILMGPRPSHAPYFSEDAALLASLAGILAAVLDNLSLQQRRHEQEQLAQELTLHASRSELKALRAQINPHFLFNALNAIAGLIHRHPARADRTIEQLAEVFRYALRSSDDEWTPLGDEVRFVQSYLAVERARFGDRLQTEVHVADAAAQTRIPTMVVQTLVENAVKHGLTEVRGAAIVGVDARVAADRLVVSVTDNGPGFTPAALAAAGASTAGGGYGLANIRHRLRGYFGERASLVITRDHARGLTVVSVEMPLDGEIAAGHPRQEAAS